MRPWCNCGPAWTDRELHAPECNDCEDAYDLGRATALEEAAKVADTLLLRLPPGERTGLEVAAAIRALKAKPPE